MLEYTGSMMILTHIIKEIFIINLQDNYLNIFLENRFNALFKNMKCSKNDGSEEKNLGSKLL